jgi:hypothetical protein
MTRSSAFMEYLKIHEISLMQDLEEIDYVNKVADMYDDVLRDLYNKNLNRRDK